MRSCRQPENRSRRCQVPESQSMFEASLLPLTTSAVLHYATVYILLQAADTNASGPARSAPLPLMGAESRAGGQVRPRGIAQPGAEVHLELRNGRYPRHNHVRLLPPLAVGNLDPRADSLPSPCGRLSLVWHDANIGIRCRANIAKGQSQRVDMEIVDGSNHRNTYQNKKNINGETRMAITTHADADLGICFKNHLDKGELPSTGSTSRPGSL